MENPMKEILEWDIYESFFLVKLTEKILFVYIDGPFFAIRTRVLYCFFQACLLPQLHLTETFLH